MDRRPRGRPLLRLRLEPPGHWRCIYPGGASLTAPIPARRGKIDGVDGGRAPGRTATRRPSPGQGEIPDPGLDKLSQALGAAGILIQAAWLAGFALFALRRGPLPFGALTLLVLAPTALMTLVSDDYRFLPGAFLAGLVADLLVRRLRFGSARRTDAVIAFAIPAGFYAAYFATVQLTGGIGWTVHLWLGAIVLAGIIGLALDEAMRGGRRIDVRER